METSGLAGIGKFVLRGRQYLGCLRVRDRVLTLEQMHFADEVDPPRGIVPAKLPTVSMLAVPASSAQGAADELVDSGVRIIFNYSEALLDVAHDVQVHTSNPAVELLHALYFHLA